VNFVVLKALDANVLQHRVCITKL